MRRIKAHDLFSFPYQIEKETITTKKGDASINDAGGLDLPPFPDIVNDSWYFLDGNIVHKVNCILSFVNNLQKIPNNKYAVEYVKNFFIKYSEY